MRIARSLGGTLRLALAAFITGTSVPAIAQSPAQDSAYAAVTKLFDAMRAKDTASMRAAFVPNASLQSLRPDSVRFDSIDGWIGGIGRARADVVLDERLANPVVHLDGDLASVWVDYWFFVGDRLSHCGVDAILLARHRGGWRIFSVVDTRRTTGCPPAPPR